MKKRTTRTCQKCNRNISRSNYDRHVDSCDGTYFTGSTNPNKKHRQMNDFKVKECFDSEINLYCCPDCDVEYEKWQSLISHYYRIHTKEGKAFRPNNIGHAAWNKGLTKDDHESIKKQGETYSQRLKDGIIKHANKGSTISDEVKDKIRKARIKILLSGKEKMNGSRYKNGRYDGQFFHSSWELAFYVYNKEVANINLRKNDTVVLEYIYNNEKYNYVPDFIDAAGNIYEIKGILCNEKQEAKYKQTKHLVEYYFGSDISEHLSYCRKKYGNKFWEFFYENGGGSQI